MPEELRTMKARGVLLVLGLVLSGMFFAFGIHELVRAYSVNNPLEFIMLFFSSCLVILINATIFLALAVRSYQLLNWRNTSRKEEPKALSQV